VEIDKKIAYLLKPIGKHKIYKTLKEAG
jgi:hypothetical protein